MDTRIGFELISLLMASRQERERYQDDPDGYLTARGLTPDEARSFRAASPRTGSPSRRGSPPASGTRGPGRRTRP